VNRERPATAIIHDTPDARLVVFRLAPGQTVPLHRSTSSVLLTVVSGTGFVLAQDGGHVVTPGAVVTFDRGEQHGMRASEEELVILATIVPRPGARRVEDSAVEAEASTAAGAG
jgi:quercetin dioxygenase-like cupin family protein